MSIKSTGNEANVKNNDGSFELPDHNFNENSEDSSSLNNSENIENYSKENREKVLERKRLKLEKEKNKLSNEQTEIQKEINKLTSAEKLAQKLAMVDEKTKENILQSTLKTEDINYFEGCIQYSYQDEPRQETSIKTTNGVSTTTTKEVIDTITRSFVLGFKYHLHNENERIYAVKIRDKWFLKDDILALYFAFQEEISKSFKFWLEDFRETQRKIQEQREKDKEQLSLFSDSFAYSGTKDVIVKLKMYNNHENKWIDFNFPIALGKFYGLSISKNQTMTSQDIYFLYHNFEKIIKQFLNK